MQAFEVTREEQSTTYYGLAISTAPDNAEAFYTEWTEIGGALLEWSRHREELAERVHLSVVTDESNHTEFKGIVDQVYESEETLSPLLKSLTFTVSFLDSRGQPVTEFEYSDGKPAISKAVSKPDESDSGNRRSTANAGDQAMTASEVDSILRAAQEAFSEAATKEGFERALKYKRSAELFDKLVKARQLPREYQRQAATARKLSVEDSTSDRGFFQKIAALFSRG